MPRVFIFESRFGRLSSFKSPAGLDKSDCKTAGMHTSGYPTPTTGMGVKRHVLEH
jgi:hypothetical protein